MSTSAVEAVESVLTHLRTMMHAHSTINIVAVQQTLRKLKIELTKLRTLPPFTDPPAVVQKNLLLARESYELACFVSILSRDVDSFLRHITQLRPYYLDFVTSLPPSDNRAALVGMHLLCLLAQNQLAVFHTELELVGQGLPPAERAALLADPCINFSVQLEQFVMEGCYNKVLAARATIPRPEYTFFLDALIDAVRDKIAACAETAYTSLPVSQLPRLLLLESTHVPEFISKRGWSEVDGRIVFTRQREESQTVDHQFLILKSLQYANELEQIV